MNKNSEAISREELPDYIISVVELENNAQEILQQIAEQRNALIKPCAKVFALSISPEVIFMDCSEDWTTKILGEGVFALSNYTGDKNITVNCKKKDGKLAIHKLEYYTIIADIDQTTNGVTGIYLMDNDDLEEEEQYDDEDCDEDEDEDYEEEEDDDYDDEAEEEDDD